jgi:hypothetical protein
MKKKDTEPQAEVFTVDEMRALRHVLGHFRSDYQGDEDVELEFAGLDEKQIREFKRKTESRHAWPNEA